MNPDAKDLIPDESQLLCDIAGLIKGAKQQTAQQLNAQLTELSASQDHTETPSLRPQGDVVGGVLWGRCRGKRMCWVLGSPRGGEWGKHILGLTKHQRPRPLWPFARNCLRAAETFPGEEIVYALRRQLKGTNDER